MRAAAFACATLALIVGVSACSDRSEHPATAEPSEPATAQESGLELWKWQASDGSYAWPVAADDGRVYVSVGGLYVCCDNFSLRPGYLAQLDGATGAELWRLQTPSQAFPASVAGGRAYFGTADGTVFAVDTGSGREAWRTQFDGIPFQVLLAGTTVVVGDADPETWGPGGLADKTRLRGRVWALDQRTGAVRWKVNTDRFQAFIATEGEFVLVATYDPRAYPQPEMMGEAIAIDATNGKELWRTPVGPATSPPALTSRFGLAGSAAGSLTALDRRTGSVRWRKSPQAGGGYYFPAASESIVLAATNTGNAEALKVSDGSILWRSQIGDCASFQSLAGDRGFVTPCGRLQALDLGTGRTLWQAPPVTEGGTTMPILQKGRLYIGGFDGVVRAFAP